MELAQFLAIFQECFATASLVDNVKAVFAQTNDNFQVDQFGQSTCQFADATAGNQTVHVVDQNVRRRALMDIQTVCFDFFDAFSFLSIFCGC